MEAPSIPGHLTLLYEKGPTIPPHVIDQLLVLVGQLCKGVTVDHLHQLLDLLLMGTALYTKQTNRQNIHNHELQGMQDKSIVMPVLCPFHCSTTTLN